MNEMPSTPDAESAADQTPTLNQVVHKIAWQINKQILSPGEAAELRRLEADRPSGPAFCKVIVFEVEPAGQLVGADGEARWALILRSIAELSELDLPKRPLGSACAEAKIGEERVDRLLRCDLATLPGTLRAITHQLASAAVRVDLADLAWLVVTARGDRPAREQESGVRRRIARDYFRGLRKATEDSKTAISN